MSSFQKKGWGDHFDAKGAILGFVLFVLLGLLLGSFTGWLAALALGVGAMNVTAMVMRRKAGRQPPRPVDPAEQELASYAGPRFAREERAGRQRGH
jgi:hypothetical protein